MHHVVALPMANGSEDLEWLLHQFSCEGASLPSLKSSVLQKDAHAAAGTFSIGAVPSQGPDDGIHDSFRDILSRSPYIFVANKRQEALLIQAASMEKPVFKLTNTIPSNLPSSIKQNLSPPPPLRGDVWPPAEKRSPKQAAAVQVKAANAGVPATMPRNGRLSAPPKLETTYAGASGKVAEKRGKQAVMQRLDRLRSDDELRALFQQRMHQYIEKEKTLSDANRSGRLSPLQKNCKEARLLTLQNRINRLEELREVPPALCVHPLVLVHFLHQAREQTMERVRESLINQRQTFLDKMAEKSRHEQWLELKRAQQRERALQKARDELSRKWITACFAVNALLSIRSLFAVCRLKLPLLKRLKYSTRVIIRTYRQYRLWKETKRIEKEVRYDMWCAVNHVATGVTHACPWQKNVCSRVCWRYLLNWHIKKKIGALAAIKEMLNILKSMGVLQKAVRSFKYRVIVGQRCISSFLAVTRARVRVQQLQWAVMHLAWAKCVAERQAKQNKTKVPPTISAIYQRLVGHYKSHGFRPPPCMVKRYCAFMRGSELFPLVVDTNAEEVPCSTALLIVSQLGQSQKVIRKQYLARREVALAGNAPIQEQETNIRIRMQARSLLCKMSVEEKIKYEESISQLQRTYARAPAYPCSMLKSQLLKSMAEYVAKADAASAPSVTVKMEVVGD